MLYSFPAAHNDGRTSKPRPQRSVFSGGLNPPPSHLDMEHRCGHRMTTFAELSLPSSARLSGVVWLGTRLRRGTGLAQPLAEAPPRLELEGIQLLRHRDESEQAAEGVLLDLVLQLVLEQAEVAAEPGWVDV